MKTVETMIIMISANLRSSLKNMTRGVAEKVSALFTYLMRRTYRQIDYLKRFIHFTLTNEGI